MHRISLPSRETENTCRQPSRSLAHRNRLPPSIHSTSPRASPFLSQSMSPHATSTQVSSFSVRIGLTLPEKEDTWVDVAWGDINPGVFFLGQDRPYFARARLADHHDVCVLKPVQLLN